MRIFCVSMVLPMRKSGPRSRGSCCSTQNWRGAITAALKKRQPPDTLFFESAGRLLVFNGLLVDAADDTGADGAAAFTDGEALADVHGDRRDELDAQSDVVARH